MRKAVWLALAGLMSACYRPDLERCRIRCTEACPAQLTCGPDGFCHSSGDELCTDDGDGGVDGSVTLDYLSISIGRGHACGLRQGGALRCWGENALGQLGVNTTEPFEGEPQDVPGTFRQVSVGDSHTCAIRDDGHLACWGWNEWGQVGVDPQIETNVTAPEDVDDNTDWIRVSAGRFHTCGIRGTEADGGVVYCWGADDFGQLGDGSAGTQRFTPMAIDTSITGWRQIGAGGFHSCASWDSETYCWGAGDHGETGDPALAQHASPFTVPGSHVFASLTVGEFVSCGIEDDAVWCWGEQPDGSFEADPQTVASGSYTLVSTNYYNTCAVHSAGVRCWGVGDEGQYGDGSWEYGPGLHDVEGLTGIISISAGRIASCAVDGAGGAWCWGSNAQGQLGVGTVATQFTPKRITTLSGWDKVVAGVDHSCAIHDGDLWCWGLDGDLQLGAGTADSAVPVQVTQTGWIDVALGNKHTCGLLDVAGAHQLWCWGDDTVEQLGNSGLGGDRAPARIGLFDDYETIVSAFGDGATCATRPGDLRWCWGEEVFGQLGDGSSGGHLAGPTLINDGAWTAITLGYQFGCGVQGGDLFCFGTDLYQQQGRTAGDDSSTTPVATETTLPWTAVAAGGGHACAIESGNVWCWGDSTYGNVGDGFTGQREIPTSIRTGSQVTAGLVHTCAIDAGALYCWGGNYDGQLGEPTLGDGTLTPQPIAQTQAWSSVSAGYVHTCAIEDVTGDLYCWGDGRHGQLGNGAMSSNVPVSVH